MDTRLENFSSETWSCGVGQPSGLPSSPDDGSKGHPNSVIKSRSLDTDQIKRNEIAGVKNKVNDLKRLYLPFRTMIGNRISIIRIMAR